MKIYNFSAISIFFFLSVTNSQVTRDWVQVYDGPGHGDDKAVSIVIDGSENVYVTGTSAASSTNYDIATIKYNSAGVRQWVIRYNGPGNGNDQANAMAVDGSGNVYVTGFASVNGQGFDFVTIKYNSSGTQQWARFYNGPGNQNDVAVSIGIDGSGNVYATGYSTGSGNSSYDYATIKYNSSGVQLWVQRYNGTGNSADDPSSIAVDASGNVYVTGTSYGIVSSSDYATIKYNTSGVQQWIARYNGPGYSYDLPNSLAIDGSGNVYVTGQSVGISTDYDYATVKYNSSGVQQWAQRYNGTGNFYDVANTVAVDGSGNVYVTGVSVETGTHNDCTTIKYNSAGVQQWLQRYNGPQNNDDGANSIAIDASGNVYITGSTIPNPSSWGDNLTVKYNNSGVQQWVQTYHGPANLGDNGSSIVVSSTGNVYVTGFSKDSSTSYDYCTIKYSQQIGIKKISSEIPDRYYLSQNYPNPFNPVTNIGFSLPKSENVILVIIDVTGKIVENLVNEKLEAGTYSISWNAVGFSSGIYFYRITAGVYNQTRKIILLK